MSATVKVCRKCGVDVSGAERFKDAAGRYVCKPCAAGAAGSGAAKPSARPPALTPEPKPESEPETFGLELPAVAAAPTTSPCPECGRPVAMGARVCVSCGYNKDTGRVAQAITDPPGMTRKERKGKKSGPEGMVCVDCGYDLKGLKAPKCPECGRVNSRYTQKSASAKRELRSMYLRPLVGAAIGAAITLGIVWLHSGTVEAVVGSLVLLAATTVLGFITYLACSVMFIGFDEPIGVTFARICCVYGLYSVAATLLGFVPVFGILLLVLIWMLKGAILAGLLVQIMELDFEDAKFVALGSIAVNIAVYLAVAGMLSDR